MGTHLHKIAGCDDEDRVADIIFVHGLNPFSGDSRQIAFETWGERYIERDFWPAWLYEDLRKSEYGSISVGVWLLEYDSAAIGWRGYAMSLKDRAANIYATFYGANIGEKPIIFVCHSLGGLTVKMILERGFTDGVNNWLPIAKEVRAIIFLSTPHSGATLATFALRFKRLLKLTPAILELALNAKESYHLARWYGNYTKSVNISTLSYHETRKTSGFTVVNSKSADPEVCGIESVPMEFDHISIAKLTSRKDAVYTGALRFVKENLKKLTKFATISTRPDWSSSIGQGDSHTTNQTKEAAAEMIKTFNEWEQDGILPPERAEEYRREEIGYLRLSLQATSKRKTS